MLAKHPLQSGCDKPFDTRRLAEALRLAIAAELDAVNLYLQFARCSGDEKARRLFEDVAREEKTHVGEFLELLRRIDPEQAEELVKGAREAGEILEGGGGGSSRGSASEEVNSGSGSGWTELVARAFREVLESARVLRRLVSTVRVGPGVEAVALPGLRVSNGVFESRATGVTGLHELSVEVVLGHRDAERIEATGRVDAPAVEAAARRMAMMEDKLVADALVERAAVRLPLGDWSNPEEPVNRVADALARLEAEGPLPPYVLAVPPSLYVKLLAVHDRTGLTVLDRLEKMVRVVRAPVLPGDTAVVFSASPYAVDVAETELGFEYLGMEPGGAHRFRAWRYAAARVLDPSQVAVLRKG